jgi:hypothetical protein
MESEWKDTEPVKQVQPECAGVHRRSQIAVCRREHTDVYGDWLSAAYPLKFALLKNAQEGDLRLRRDVANLIEEDRSSICLFKPARMPLTWRR